MNIIKKTVGKTISNTQKIMSKSGMPSYRQGKTFLHGHLIIEVRAAQGLPDMEGWVSKLVDKKDVTDPFVDVRLGRAKLAKTSVVLNNLNPEWNEMYRVEVCHFAEDLIFEIRDKDHAYSEYIGSVSIPTSSLLNGETREGWYNILKKSGKSNGQLHIFVEFRSKASLEKTYQVDCYFPMHNNCRFAFCYFLTVERFQFHDFFRVTLYQDAHCLPNMPQFTAMERPDGQIHNPRSCWTDLYNTIMNAQEIICITGWAVWDKLQLFRGPDLAKDSRTLGEILVNKAEQGVAVYVMVWSEKTSGEILGKSIA